MLQDVTFIPGDIVRVHQKIQETDAKGNEKTRIQIFEGTVLGIKGRGDGRAFTVRKMVGDIAVERIWPIKSPNIEKVDVKGHLKEKTHKAKLYHLRTKVGRK